MKRLALLVATLLVLVAASVGAQNFVRPGQLSLSWECSLNGLAATLTECEPLVAGERLYITDVSVQTTTGVSGQYAIQHGTGTNCGTGTTALFPSSGTADRFNAPINSQPMAHLRFVTPLRPAVGNAICVIGTATNTISIQMQGFREAR